MLLQYHKDCKEKNPHKPEIEIEVKTFKEACEEIRKAKVKCGYLDWNEPKHYIVYPTFIEDYTKYHETVTTQTFKP